jgi:hypothetical protein
MSTRRRSDHRPATILEATYAGVPARLQRAEGTYGTPRPRILLELPRGTSHRVTAAKAYTLAAAVELASEAYRARWVVCVTAEETVAWVDLELSEGLPNEVEAGLDTLRTVLSQAADA